MTKISVVLNTFNEEKNIKRCLESVKWADEIVIVDMHSSDKTIEICKSYTKNIFFHKQTDFVEPARNFAISKASGNWILVVDADEEIPQSLSDKLLEIVSGNSYDYVKIARKNIIFGKWIKHTGWWPDYLIRFFKKGNVTWKEEIHSIPEAKGRGLTLADEYAIVHHNYVSVSQFIIKNYINYARIEADEKLKSDYVFSYKDLIKFPLQEFLTRYFYWRGYKDGLHGLALSLLMAFYHLAVFLYIWEDKGFSEYSSKDFLSETEKEFKKAGKDISFWFAKEKLESMRNPITRNIAKIRNKIRGY